MTYAKDAATPFYHGTRADLAVGDLFAPGFNSNYQERKLSWIYFSGTLEAAVWGAELAAGDGRERIYIVEPTGSFEDDPNLTDKKFPGNQARSHAGGMASTAVTFSPIAPARRSGSRARSRIGRGTRPNG